MTEGTSSPQQGWGTFSSYSFEQLNIPEDYLPSHEISGIIICRVCSGREGRTVVLGLAVSSLLLLPKESENKSQNPFLPSSLNAYQKSFWTDTFTTSENLGKFTDPQPPYLWPTPKSDPSVPYLDFIASEELHLNGLLQYSLSVHVSSCLDYLSRKNTFRRAKRWLNNVLSTGLLHRPQEHTSTAPTCSSPTSALSSGICMLSTLRATG